MVGGSDKGLSGSSVGNRVPLPWSWHEDAACRGVPGDPFFGPDREVAPARAEREARAVAICGPCPVRMACRRHALSRPEPYGVWGGLTETERYRLRRGGLEPRAA